MLSEDAFQLPRVTVVKHPMKIYVHFFNYLFELSLGRVVPSIRKFE